jgi:hypothetical protein
MVCLLKARTVNPAETAVVRERLCKQTRSRQQLRKHATIPETSLGNVRMQQWKTCWKMCGPAEAI